MANASILITGCSTGIGYTTALGLKASGWRVFATARKPEDVKRLSDEGLEALCLDVTDSSQIKTCLNQVLSATGGTLDAVFHNAGFGQPGAVEDVPRDALREQFETNVFGVWELNNAVMPIMREQGHGRLLFNSSVLGFAAMPFRGAYNSSKYALEGMVDTLRLELRGTEIYPVLIEPGPIISQFRANCRPPFNKWINADNSFWADTYQKMRERNDIEGAAAPFTLPPEAVLKVVEKALVSPRPPARYPVTKPTVAFYWAKRLLPTVLVDAMAYKAGKS